MRRRRVQIEIFLLHVLAVVAFICRETKQALLQNGIPAIPERQSEAQTTLPVRDSEQAIFAPPIGPAASLIVRKIFPASRPFGIVLAHRGPLAFGQIRPPALPIFCSSFVLFESNDFGCR